VDRDTPVSKTPTHPFITKEVIQGVILELGAIVTSDHQYIFDGLLGLMLVLEEIYPCIS
jgi:hypothetical protein